MPQRANGRVDAGCLITLGYKDVYLSVLSWAGMGVRFVFMSLELSIGPGMQRVLQEDIPDHHLS